MQMILTIWNLLQILLKESKKNSIYRRRRFMQKLNNIIS